MAITFTLKDNGNSSTAGQTQASNSYTPTANKLILAAIGTRNRFASPAGIVSATGNNLTWVEIAHIIYGPTGQQNSLTLLRAMGAAPSTGATTFTSTGTGQTAFTWQITEVDGIDTSGTNGSGAIVQSTTNSTDGGGQPYDLVVTLSALTGNNATFACFSSDNATGTLGVKTGYTELSKDASASPLNSDSVYKVPGDTTPTTTSLVSFDDYGGIAIEIKAAPAGGPVVAWFIA